MKLPCHFQETQPYSKSSGLSALVILPPLKFVLFPEHATMSCHVSDYIQVTLKFKTRLSFSLLMYSLSFFKAQSTPLVCEVFTDFFFLRFWCFLQSPSLEFCVCVTKSPATGHYFNCSWLCPLCILMRTLGSTALCSCLISFVSICGMGGSVH